MDWILVFALPDEARPFLRQWKLATGATAKRLRSGALPGAMSGWCCGSGEAWTCGMGPRNAARWLDLVLGTRRPSFVITAGFAGGLDPALKPGDLVASWDPGFRPIVGVHSGRIHCADQVVVTAGAKAELRARTGADAVEMESGVIRAGCAERGILSATVRAISDVAGEDLPLDFGALLTADDRLHFGKLAWRLARSPGLIPGLLRLQKNVGIAGERLAEVLVRHLNSI